jgi:hypothetical protein
MTPAGAAPVMPPGYRYLRHLGAGGFGDVHLAEHAATGRWVAVKHIQAHHLADPDMLARFRREAQVLAATDVTTVVRVYDLDLDGDPACLLMEYVPGVTLWDLMEQAPLPAWQALIALRDVADALRSMAEHGLVHRDIKPSNVFVLPTGRAKLGDFGLARPVVADGGFRTTGPAAGTPAYFPPEVSSGQLEATVESDAYSFAVMAYEVLTGARPIDAPDAISMITAHWTQPPRPVTDAMPGFPPSAAAVLMAALAKEPAGRPLPHEVVAALESVPEEAWPTNDRSPVEVPDAPPVEGLPVPPRAAPVTVLAPGEGADPPAPTRRLPGRPRRRYAGVAVVACALVAVAVGVAAVVGQPSGDGPDPQRSAALAVTAVAVSADPSVVRCPAATVHLVARIGTNGAAGTVAVSWLLPDGSHGPEQSFALTDGQREVVARLDATLTGTRPVDGQATAVVRPAGLRGSTPVRYRCAG